MAFKWDSRIKETSVSTGTGAMTLDGAPSDHLPFSTIGANNHTPYSIVMGSAWEEGIGQYLSGPSRLSRSLVLRSTNANALVNFGVGTKTVRCVLPASMTVFRRFGGYVTSAASLDLDSVQGDYCHVLGTAQITAITLAEGREITTTFAGNCSLVGSASLLLPAYGTLTAVVGDSAVWRGEAAGVVRLMQYHRVGAMPQLLTEVLTTRGDILRRGASAPERLGLGTTGWVLMSDGTDVGWYGPVSAGGINTARSLVCDRTGASTVQVSSTQIVLGSTTGRVKRASLGATTVNLTASGAGGLDTGAEANSTWYYIWIIAKEDGTASAIFSASSTSPTLPAEYIYQTLVSAIYNDSGGNLLDQRQEGFTVSYRAQKALITGGLHGVPTLLSATTVVPPTAVGITIRLVSYNSQQNSYSQAFILGSNNSAHVLMDATASMANVASNMHNGVCTEVVHPDSPQSPYYMVGGSSGSQTADVYVLGFKLY